MSNDPQPAVIFTVKEMFLDIRVQLRDISDKLDRKADQASVDAAVKRIELLEMAHNAASKWSESRRWAVTTVLTACAVASGILGWVVR